MNNKYMYISTFGNGEEQLHNLFYRQLFQQDIQNQVILSNIDFDITRSILIKHKLEILHTAKNMNDLCQQIEANKLDFDTFQIVYLKHPTLDITYESRLSELKEVGFVIEGEIDVKHPKQLLGLTKVGDTYYFGYLLTLKNNTLQHVSKPNSYSFACSVRTARILANLAMKHDVSKSVIDPCCGSGNVLLELLTIGANPVGNELIPKVVDIAKQNLSHFGYELDILNKDIIDIKEWYDTIILDIPYGVFVPIDPAIQDTIIKACSTISNHLVILTNEVMNPLLAKHGYTIIDQAPVYKGKFVRYITIAEIK